MNSRFIALAGALWLSAGALAAADQTPSPSPSPQSLPALPAIPNIPGLPAGLQNSPIVQSILNSLGGITQSTNGNAAHGKVTFYRRFDLQVETAPSVFRQIHLHQGTIINPRGVTLQPGMIVDVSGSAESDRSLDANEITVR